MKASKYEELRLHYKIWFTDKDDNGILGDGKYKILKAIDETGSLMSACEKLGITYRRTWNDLKSIEKRLGFPLLEKTRGGTDGGSSTLTPEGRKLIRAFDNFHENMDEIMQHHFKVLKHQLLSDE
ncbi:MULTISPECIES: LysR family transcriptional regulator [Lentimicrobium]|jgi:molybdate transport system regulatory protein|uniref:DNA-binding transcriptional regulator ModE n=1 Tax=Lentimicrobium saccharophilum TaxID=1678841 RepID=A0A0S7C706_9BACT|nr:MULTISPECIES: LysR family transcriptional regulator [Lentimicrobium]MCO5255922.1 LysR family transcriptional regulator [Lentimicrobium sp.]MCO5263293.1 LysR family transcriptional regulator [Lentimicrobium sp.]GAP45033.1 DNA-binding transcriptional regulator ModE [Lentimicrobium saccharophilum]HOP12479.1 LysR family transcriptional regulator [Lentimicrobium sp.]HPF63700.1 LysR family transcriptional regulator [Lentimicrobium sp.]